MAESLVWAAAQWIGRTHERHKKRPRWRSIVWHPPALDRSAMGCRPDRECLGRRCVGRRPLWAL